MPRFFSFFQKRRHDMRASAEQLGLNFQETDEYGLIGMMRDFELFKRGYGKRISNIISTGKSSIEDPDMRIFDYKYVIGAGNNTRVINQTVFYIHSKKLQLPQLLLKPENFFNRIGIYLGKQDIDFEAFPVFSRQYVVRGDESQVRNTLQDDILHYFTVEKNWSLEGLNYLLVLYVKGKRFKPDQIEWFYKKGQEIYQLFAQEEE